MQNLQNEHTHVDKNNKIIDLVVTVLLFLFALWYLYDTYTASSRVENLILIAPIAVIVMALCIFEFIRNIKDKNTEKKEQAKNAIIGIIIFGAYILSLEYLGFDIGTAVFMAIYLIVNGERRWFLIAFYSIVFALVISAFFAYMLPYPMPMSILPTDY